MKFDFSKKTFIIAEIGGNHEGSFARAKKLLRLAAASGADSVKFQVYKGEKLVSPLEMGKIDPAAVERFRRFSLTDEQWFQLIKLAKRYKIMFSASVWDIDSVNKLDKYLSFYKVGSGDLTAYPLLEVIAKKNKPIILSTAMSNLKEIKATVNFIKHINPGLIQKKQLALLHCVAMYGDPRDEYTNLLAMKKLKKTFPHLPIGYSDHTKGIFACQIALAMGARIVEKHFTDNKGRKFRDHAISATSKEMRELVESAKRIQLVLGKSKKESVLPVENKARIQWFRRALYLRRDMEKGKRVTKRDFIILRPNVGIDARDFYKVLGKKLKVPKKAFEKLSLRDFL